MNVIDLPSDFYSQRNLPIRYKVWHRTEGTDSRNWLTKTGGVSSHYLIRGGDILQLVDEGWDAWHAGIIVGTPFSPHYTGVWEDVYENGVLIGGGWTVNPNDESIGIEIEGFSRDLLTPTELAACVELGRDIDARRGVLPNVGHYELSPGNRSDPGIANLVAIRTALEPPKGDDDMTPAQEAKLDRVLQLMEAREPLVWIARDQRALDVETGKAFDPSKPPYDARIKT